MIDNNTYFDLFKGRTDTVGRSSTMSTSVNNIDEIKSLIDKHLAGQQRLGFYNLLPDGTTPWAMVEFEWHDDKGGISNSEEMSLRFMEHLHNSGLTAYRELSKNPNGRCYHIWILFNKPLSAKKVHLSLNLFVSTVMNVKTEVFPKGFNTSSIGNFVWLPLFGGTDSFGLGINEQRTVFIDNDGLAYADQNGLLQSMVRNSEAQLDAFIKDFRLDTIGKKSAHKSFNPIKGLDKLRLCPFMNYCEQNAATLTEPLWYAWITNAIRVEDGREYIHEFSQRYPKYSHLETEKKIAHAIADTGPMTYESIAKNGWTGNAPVGFRSPFHFISHRDLNAELERIKAIVDDTEKVTAIDSLVQYVNQFDGTQREVYRSKVKNALKLSMKIFKEKAGTLTQEALDFDSSKSLKEKLELMKLCKRSVEERGAEIYKWLCDEEYLFYRNNQDTIFILFEQNLEPVSKDSVWFREFFTRVTGVSLETSDGRVYLDIVRINALRNGKPIDVASWIHSVASKHRIYFNLNNDRKEIACIDTTGVYCVEQGHNDDSAVLTKSDKILPLNLVRQTEQEYRDTLLLSKKLVVDNMACSPYNRVFALSWRIGAFFVDFTKIRPHLRFEGKSSGGKSFGTDLLTYPLYGKDQKKIGTNAGNYSDAAMNPIVILDNLETQNMNREQGDFILLQATGAIREKRKMGTDSGLVHEQGKCLVLSNGIENFSANEILNRTYIVEFDKLIYGNDVTGSVFAEILKHRDAIISAEFHLVSKVLKRIQIGDQSKFVNEIRKRYGRHEKERTDEFLAIMALITEELLSAWGSSEDIWDYLDEWIATQNLLTRETNSGANVILTIFETLRRKVEKSFYGNFTGNMLQLDITYQRDPTTKKITFEGLAIDFHNTFDKILGRGRYHFNNAQQLAKRIADAEKILAEKGYTYTATKDRDRNVYVVTYDPNTGSTPSATSVPQTVPQS